jgi:hypothetical protein
MPRSKKVPAPQVIEPRREASLLGLPAELRNNINRMIADDIDEVKIIGRKIGFGRADAEDRFWDTVTKHTLSQTCRQLRQEFVPIHRHTVMTTGVPHYCLEVENYDIGRLDSFARLLEQVPSVLPHIQASARAGRPLVHFQLNNNLMTSLKKLGLDVENQGTLPALFMRLRELFREVSSIHNSVGYHNTRSTWWESRGIVSINMRSQEMSVVEKRAAVTQARAKDARKFFVGICKYRARYSRDGNSDGEYMHLLARLHSFEHARVARKLMKNKLWPELRAQLTREIRDEVEVKLRKQLKMTPNKQIYILRGRKCLREDLKRELKAELKETISSDVEVEVKAQLLAEKEASRAKEKEKFRAELRQELKAELMVEVRAEVEAELREKLERELRTIQEVSLSGRGFEGLSELLGSSAQT